MSRAESANKGLPSDRQAFLEAAFADDDSSISVGGWQKTIHQSSKSPSQDEMNVSLSPIGLIISIARHAKGWSQATLAQQAKVDLDEVIAVESNPDFEIPSTTVERLAGCFRFQSRALHAFAKSRQDVREGSTNPLLGPNGSAVFTFVQLQELLSEPIGDRP